MEQFVGSADPWVVPFVVQLVGEHVLEILVAIRDGLLDLDLDLDTPGTRGHIAYGTFLADNPAFFARTQRRVVSYWNCNYRFAYASFVGYPGCALLGLLRSAAADMTEPPCPTPPRPSARTRTDGHS
ncbi:hypothetical protein ACFYXJ_15350 [Streptomyces sp. NPDC002667]|uniref:hypothetical protein n=1 Tax=Streptomyces sp. NPDC002667 TaxID=3364657 RepID=UPI0036C8CE94